MRNLAILGMGMEDLADLVKDRVAFVDGEVIAYMDFAALAFL